jgi:hypothetical protein
MRFDMDVLLARSAERFDPSLTLQAGRRLNSGGISFRFGD